jgi:hypothetical protein
VDVCLQKSNPNLSEGILNIALCEFPVASQFFEDQGKLVGQLVEHELRANSATIYIAND